MRRLIVNADDFGLTSGVNRAIIELHAAGLVTSTSLMARAGATGEAIELARATPSLGVGCHVVLVDGEPVLPPEKIPSLVDTGPALPEFAHGISAAAFHRPHPRERNRGRSRRANRSFAARGVRLTHIDTHKHAHIFSSVLRPVLRAARAAGIRAVRHPFEPEWAVRAAIGAPLARVAQIAALRPLAPRPAESLHKRASSPPMEPSLSPARAPLMPRPCVPCWTASSRYMGIRHPSRL